MLRTALLRSERFLYFSRHVALALFATPPLTRRDGRRDLYRDCAARILNPAAALTPHQCCLTGNHPPRRQRSSLGMPARQPQGMDGDEGVSARSDRPAEANASISAESRRPQGHRVHGIQGRISPGASERWHTGRVCSHHGITEIRWHQSRGSRCCGSARHRAGWHLFP